jgi:hypothetical protein
LASYKFNDVYPSATGKELHGILQLKDEVFHLTIPVDLSERGDSIAATGDFNIERINPELFQVLAGKGDRDSIQSVEVHLEIVAERRETDN